MKESDKTVEKQKKHMLKQKRVKQNKKLKKKTKN